MAATFHRLALGGSHRLPGQAIHYWRDMRGHEVDFVLDRRGRPPVAIECKWSEAGADGLSGLAAFRRAYPAGENILVAADAQRPVDRRIGGMRVSVLRLEELVDRLGS